MQEFELELKGQVYRVGKLSPMESFHVARKLAPALAAMSGPILEWLKNRTENVRFDVTEIAMVAGPVADVISKMSNAEVEYVLKTCLSVVFRKQDDRWAALISNGGFMFQDIDMMIMLRLSTEVVRHNLGSFFLTLPTEDPS